MEQSMSLLCQTSGKTQIEKPKKNKGMMDENESVQTHRGRGGKRPESPYVGQMFLVD